MPTHPIVFMFSGQGSHYYQMGYELFEQQPVFKQSLLRLDEVAVELLGQSVVEMLYHPQHKKMAVFDQTRFTHPAIFMVELALAETLLDADIVPDYVLGASMGAFAAATVAGSLDADRALAAVIHQAEMLENHCKAGGMIAVLAEPFLYDRNRELSTHTTLAALNFAKHFVVSGRATHLSDVEGWLTGQGITYQRLAVSQAFHSAVIDDAGAPFLAYMARQTLAAPTVPMVCTIDRTLLRELSSNYFWQVIREPINLQQTIEYLEADHHYHYIDLGPSGTLATFLNYNRLSDSLSQVSPLMTPYGGEVDKLRRLLNK